MLIQYYTAVNKVYQSMRNSMNSNSFFNKLHHLMIRVGEINIAHPVPQHYLLVICATSLSLSAG
jgi:hypothetical protein